MIYSIVADTSTTVYGSNATYATARTLSTGIFASSLTVGQRRHTTAVYFCYASFLRFNTSIIPLGTPISKVSMSLTVEADLSTYAEFNIDIIELDWRLQDPITSANQETVFDNSRNFSTPVVLRNTSGIGVNTPYLSPLLTKTYPTLGGYTYYGLRSSRWAAGSAPGTSGTNEYVNVANHLNATEAYRPTLLIETVSSLPVIWL